MVSASLKADTRSTYSSSSLFNTSPGSWSQAGWFEECFGGGAEEQVHAGNVFGSSLAPSSYRFKRRRAMDTNGTNTNENNPKFFFGGGAKFGLEVESWGVSIFKTTVTTCQVLEPFTGRLKAEKQEKHKSLYISRFTKACWCKHKDIHTTVSESQVSW